MIHFDENSRVFHLAGKNSSYLIGIATSGDLLQLHWGRKLDAAEIVELSELGFRAPREGFRDLQKREYGSFGNNDLRAPAVQLEYADGSRLSEFVYLSHTIKGDTLKITLGDSLSGQVLELSYELFSELDIVKRGASLIQGAHAGRLRRLMAASIDLAPGEYRVLSLPGDWARERQEQWTAAPSSATLRFESKRGISSHQLSPFVALARGDAGEDEGEVFGATLVYSGNWLIEVEGHFSGGLRLNAGLNDFDFAWQLDTGERFTSPDAVLVYSGQGLGDLSRKLHRYVNRHLISAAWAGVRRPVLINSWEAHYFKFKDSDILRLANEAKTLGVELLVLDDGWFGKRDDDTTSMGDWFDDLAKLPRGVKGLAEDVHKLGMKFGLWFEPEAISPKSELFQKHPDWAFAVSGRKPSVARNQYVLDLGRPEVQDFLFERMDHYVREAKLDYIKWDMNRPLWEVGSARLPAARQSELSHRFTLGVYALMQRLQMAHPGLLVESCSGGGARFDYGVMRWHPQVWASDNTDALDRIKIQWGSSYFLPPYAMGAHISTVPNHFTKRSTPLEFRAHVAMAGNLGLELDLSQTSPEDKLALKKHISEYNEIRHLVQSGEFYRLENPWKSERAAWAFVAEDKREAVVFVYQMAVGEKKALKLKGLDADQNYDIGGKVSSGKALMTEGLQLNLGDSACQSVMLRLQTRH